MAPPHLHRQQPSVVGIRPPQGRLRGAGAGSAETEGAACRAAGGRADPVPAV